TLDDILQYVIEQDLREFDYEKVHTLLLSFHLYTTVYCLLSAIDTKFWQLCFDSNLWPTAKYNLISSLGKVLDCWLDSPYVESFNCPPDFLDLNRLLFVASQWFRVFSSNFQPLRWKATKPKDFSQNQLVMKARGAIRSMTKLCQMDIARMMEGICTKVNSASEQFHLQAGIFKEANCDKDCNGVCSGSPEFTSPKGCSLYHLSPRYIAEQLTLYDADLFLKVLPSDCLNYVRHRPAPTVEPTIQQFNRIYGVVLTSIIEADNPKPSVAVSAATPSLASLTLSMVSTPLQYDQRMLSNGGRHGARVHSSVDVPSCGSFNPNSLGFASVRAEMLSKWISVAAELRALRSFSAFTAVMTALQGSAIGGLHETWSFVEAHYPEQNEVFHELAQLLTLEDNKKYARELMDHIYSSYEIGRHQDLRHNILSSIFRRKWSGEFVSNETNMMKTMGTIPYLGIFLNDLAMLHESAQDLVSRPKPKPRQPPSHANLIGIMGDHRRRLPTPSTPLQPPRRPPRQKASMTNSEDDTASHRVNAPKAVDNRRRGGCDNDDMFLSTSGEIPHCRDVKRRQGEPGTPGFSVFPSQLQPSRRRAASASPKTRDSQHNGSTPQAQSNELINFRKHYREYKVIAKLLKLQKTATRYRISEDVSFKKWFADLTLITENEANQRAKELEPSPSNLRMITGHHSGSLEVLYQDANTSHDESLGSYLSSPTPPHLIVSPCSSVGSYSHHPRINRSRSSRRSYLPFSRSDHQCLEPTTEYVHSNKN
uniref:Ras-GEF domain-containing protein n=3 Tax=Mesocestoides corti TaxID=53468 RepID=A0A5K3EIY2_MESCO